MSAAATTQTSQPAAADKPSRVGRLLDLVRRLIDYGKELAATFQQRDEATSLTSHARSFGTGDFAWILARITSGLHRAQALEARLLRNAGPLDAEPRSKAAPPRRKARAVPAARPVNDDSGVVPMPTPEQIAAEVRRRPIGAVIADICRDLGITPSHPLWRELSLVIIRHGGSLAALFKDISRRLFPLARPATGLAARPVPLAPFPAPGCTGPP